MNKKRNKRGTDYLTDSPLISLVHVLVLVRLINSRFEEIDEALTQDCMQPSEMAMFQKFLLPCYWELAAFFIEKDFGQNLLRVDACFENEILPAMANEEFPQAKKSKKALIDLARTLRISPNRLKDASLHALIGELLKEYLLEKNSDDIQIREIWHMNSVHAFFRKHRHADIRLVIDRVVEGLRENLCRDHLGSRMITLFGPPFVDDVMLACLDPDHDVFFRGPQSRVTGGKEEPPREYFVATIMPTLFRAYALAHIITNCLENRFSQIPPEAAKEVKERLSSEMCLSEAELGNWCVAQKLTSLSHEDDAYLGDAIAAVSDDCFPIAQELSAYLFAFVIEHQVLKEDEAEEEIMETCISLLHEFGKIFALSDFSRECGPRHLRTKEQWGRYFDYLPCEEFTLLARFAITRCLMYASRHVNANMRQLICNKRIGFIPQLFEHSDSDWSDGFDQDEGPVKF